MNRKLQCILASLTFLFGCAKESIPDASPVARAKSKHSSSLQWFTNQQLENQKAVPHCPFLVHADQSAAAPTTLRFTLVNPGPDTFKFAGQMPPWEWCGPNLQLLVIDSSGRILDTVHPPCSPVGGPSADLRPGESLTGDLDLTFVVDGIDEALKNGPVTIAWTYWFIASEDSCFATGAVALKQVPPN